ncbi:transposase [Candidatus Parcubacteria bacterium]|nr:MAG: transposase [Candidatus Parcubacteria bacterium]
MGATANPRRCTHLRATQPQEHIQVDIVPHYLKGGARAACFNAIDAASRYPVGKAYAHRRSSDAEDFLLHVWAELGIPKYTQVDNESCFMWWFYPSLHVRQGSAPGLASGH